MITAILAALALVAAIASGGNQDAVFRSVADDPMAMALPMRLPNAGIPDTRAWPNQSAPGRPASQARPFGIRVFGLAADGIATPEPVATATAEPTIRIPRTVEPTRDAPVFGFGGQVTHYGVGFEGQTMACGGTYWSSDTSIAAVPYPSRNSEWPCGTRFVVTGPAGSIEVVRTDSCPGCTHTQIDLSESGMIAACGYLGRCNVWIEVRR